MAQSARTIEVRATAEVLAEADVLVAGGGLSGCAAAIAAAREGAATILLERSGALGGIATSSLMTSMTNVFFNSRDDQLIRGIATEVVEEAVRRQAASEHWKTYLYRQIPFDPDVLQAILWEKLHSAGARVITHAWALRTLVEDAKVTGVVLQTRGGTKAILSRTTVDTTGDLEVVAAGSGAPYNYEKTGSASLLFEVAGVDLEKTFKYYLSHPSEYRDDISEAITFADFQENWTKRGLFQNQHGGGRYLSVIQEAIARGEYAAEKGMAKGMDALGIFAMKERGSVLVNSLFYNLDELNDVETTSAAELDARQRCIEIWQSLKRVMPGFERSSIVRMGSELGSRYTRWLDGEYRMTWEDVTKETAFADAIGVLPSVHTLGERGTRIGEHSVDVPYRMLQPRGTDNLLVGSGKTASCEQFARVRHVRYMPACMMLGQAAGTAAALAARERSSTRDIDVRKVQRALAAAGCYLR